MSEQLANNLTLQIDNMTCDHCASRVSGALKNIGATVIDIDADSGITHVTTNAWISPADYEKEVSDAGYSLRSISLSEKIVLPVIGMHCMNCVAKVEKKLSEVQGVEDVDVELESGIASISGTADLKSLVKTIDDLGYVVSEEEPELDSTGAAQSGSEEESDESPASGLKENSHHLQIKGMSCASCVATVERSLLNVPGVNSAVVNFADETAFVKATGSIEPLVAAVQKVGYEAAAVEHQTAAEKEAFNKSQFRLGVLRSGLALLGGSVLMGGMLAGALPSIENQIFWMVTGVLVLVVMFVSGGHFYRNAWHSMTYFTTTMDTLIALGTGTAWIYSMLVLLMPSIVPEDSRHLFFEAALFIIGFVNLGKSLEMNARGKASSAIEKLLNLSPDNVLLIVDNEEVPAPLSEVVVGNQLRVKPGDRIPVDGRIIEGNSNIDESMLSGESIPVDKQSGDAVSAGTINLFGSFTMQAEQVGGETTLARMIDMVKNAQNSKPPIARLTDSIAAVFVPLVLLVAVACVVYWGWIASEGSLSLVTITAMSVLIVACPCALGLAIPMSVMVGISRGANDGLLIRNSDALQAAAGIKTIILDKTGTITEGKPVVTDVLPIDESNRGKLLELAYSLEYLSEHPLALAINRYCLEKDISRANVTDFEISPGGGVSATLDGKDIKVGNAKYLSLTNTGSGESETTIYISEAGKLLGSIVLDDQIKSDSKSAIRDLQSMGISIIILSGDNPSSVSKVAGQLGVDDFESEMSPEEKLSKIKALQKNGEKVAMVGDGINDAPALGIADVGFAMGSGTDIAIESADIAIVGNQLTRVVSAIRVSKLTMRNIYQNLFGAFAYNIILIPIAAGVFYPMLINPAFAGLAMAMSSVTVVTNANRLRFARV